MSNKKNYKQQFDFTTRKDESDRIRKKYVDRVPVIVEKKEDNKTY